MAAEVTDDALSCSIDNAQNLRITNISNTLEQNLIDRLATKMIVDVQRMEDAERSAFAA